jgi:phage-related protein
LYHLVRAGESLRFMIYISIGHAFDAVEGSLLENYGWELRRLTV